MDIDRPPPEDRDAEDREPPRVDGDALRLEEGDGLRDAVDDRLLDRLETSCCEEDGRLPENDGRFPDEPLREGRADDPDGRDEPLE